MDETTFQSKNDFQTACKNSHNGTQKTCLDKWTRSKFYAPVIKLSIVSCICLFIKRKYILPIGQWGWQLPKSEGDMAGILYTRQQKYLILGITAEEDVAKNKNKKDRRGTKTLHK